MIVINDYSKPIYIVFDYCQKIIHLQQMDEHRNRLIEYMKCNVLCNEAIDVDAMKLAFAHF